jgi:hypothetical protein
VIVPHGLSDRPAGRPLAVKVRLQPESPSLAVTAVSTGLPAGPVRAGTRASVTGPWTSQVRRSVADGKLAPLTVIVTACAPGVAGSVPLIAAPFTDMPAGRPVAAASLGGRIPS